MAFARILIPIEAYLAVILKAARSLTLIAHKVFPVLVHKRVCFWRTSHSVMLMCVTEV